MQWCGGIVPLLAACPILTTVPSFLMRLGLITLKLQFITSLEAVKEGSVGCRMGWRRGVKRFVVGGIEDNSEANL
jgi:hypothetical protein